MIICLLGKSAVGKSTIEKILEEKGFSRIISCTTRPMRENEVNGKDYYFITEEEFQKTLDNDDFIEHTQYREWHYGVRKSDIDTKKDSIFVVEPNGYRQYKQKLGTSNVIGVYLQIGDKERLLRSLNRETFPDVDEIVRRYVSDKELFKDIDKEVDLVIDNWYTYETVEKILKFVKVYKALELENVYK